MASAGVISVDVQARIQNFVNGLNTCMQKAESFSNNLSGKLGGRDYFAPMRDSLKGMGRDMRQIAGGIVFAQTFYQTAQAVKAATAAVWEYTDSINYAETTFSNLFKDTDLATEFVDVLQQYAARSPFDFTDVQSAAMQLRAYGIEAQNLMFVMQGIGNLASVTGDYQLTFERVSRAIGQIYAKGKLMGEEMRQLAEAGLDVKAVYDKLGTSAQTVADDNIDAATAINAIVDVLNENYAGALDAANTTVRGMVGNIKDLMLMISSAIAQPAYDKLKSVLYMITLEFNKFQDYFTRGGLAYAIEQYFGPEVFTRVVQLINILVQLGQIIYTLAVPALKILGTYGQALAAVVGSLLTIIAPFISLLANVVNALMSTAAGSRALQAVMMGLASAFVFTKIATLGMMVIQVVQKIIAVTTSVVQAAAAMQSVYNMNLAVGATVAQAAGAAYSAFAASLKLNPLVALLSIVLALISAFVGLRSILGGVSTVAGSMSTFDASKWLNSVKTSSGDINKFNNRLANTNDQLSDMQDNLGKTGKAAKKAVEGLLSFDEVFSLPEANDSATSGSGLPSSGDLGDIPGLGDYDIPLPDIPEWGDTTGKQWFDDLVDWFKNLHWPEIAGALTAGFISAFDAAGVKIGENASLFAKKVVDKVVAALKTVPEKLRTKISVVGDQISAKISSVIAGGIKDVPSKIKTAITDFPDKVASSFLPKAKELPGKIASILSQHLTGKNILASLKDFGKTLGLSIIGDWLFDMVEKGLESIGQSGAAKVVGTFANELSVGIATLLVTKNPFAALGAAVAQHIFDAIDNSIHTGNWTGTITQITDGIMIVLSSALKGVSKGGVIGAAASIISDLIFGGISAYLEASGDSAAADITTKVGNTVSAGLTGAGIGAMIGSVVPGIGTAIGAAVGAGIGLLLGALASFWDEISAWWNDTFIPGWNDFWSFNWLHPDIDHASEVTTDQVDSDEKSWWSTLKQWWEGVKQGWKDFWSFKWLFPDTDYANEVTGEAVTSDEKSWWDALQQWWEGVKQGWNNFWSFSWLTDAATNLDNEALTPSKNKVSNWWSVGMSPFWSNVITPGWRSMWTNLGTVGKNVWSGISSWMDTIHPGISGKFSNASTWLTGAGTSIFTGLSNGLRGAIGYVSSAVGQAPGTITNPFSNASNWLYGSGTWIMQGLSNGMNNMRWSLNNMAVSLGNAIIGVFGNAGSWLYGAGTWIVQGLYNGLRDRFQSVINMVSGWGSRIASVKGPEGYDRRLLIPNGRWITGSLMTGLQKDFPDVLSAVHSWGPQMQNAFATPSFDTSQYVEVMPQSITSPLRQRTTADQDVASSVANQQESRPIVYVQTMIANKQGIRDLKRQLDVVEAENNRWR